MAVSARWAAIASASRGPRDRLVGERVADRPDQALDLLLGHLDVAQPDVLAPALAGRGGHHEVRQVVGREVVEGPPERPGLDDRAVRGERVADVVGPQAVDAGRRLELGRARDLGMEADHLADELDEAIGRRPLGEVLAASRRDRTCDQSVDSAGGGSAFGMP